MIIFVVCLLLVVIVFGVASGMQSYASAQQAQAVIETAQVAQVSAWGNLISILALVGGIVIVLALVVAVLWWMSQRNKTRHTSVSGPRVASQPQAPAIDVNALIQLEMIRALRGLNAPAREAPLLTDESEEVGFASEQPVWLMRGK